MPLPLTARERLAKDRAEVYLAESKKYLHTGDLLNARSCAREGLEQAALYGQRAHPYPRGAPLGASCRFASCCINPVKEGVPVPGRAIDPSLTVPHISRGREHPCTEKPRSSTQPAT
jgi:hypothetical protein